MINQVVLDFEEINCKEVKPNMEVKDWRGNTYSDEELLDKKCKLCGKQAIRNTCSAEGDVLRTHWHGGVHTIDRGWEFLCRVCANLENEKWIKLHQKRLAEKYS